MTWVLVTAIITAGIVAIVVASNSNGLRRDSGRRYRQLAEESERSRREIADTLVELREWATSLDAKVGSLDRRTAEIERMLREVN